MRRIVAVTLLLAACGCQSYREIIRNAQAERRMQLDVVQSLPRPVIDAAVLAAEQPFAGTCRIGRVSVQFPRGLQTLAEDLAGHLHGMYGFVEERTAVPWAFDLHVRLVRVDAAPGTASGDGVSLDGSICRVCLFVVTGDESLDALMRVNALYPYSFVHEMTELSLICPEGGASPLLVDAEIGDRRVINGTRWLREGLANYAGERVTRAYCGADPTEIIHDRPYSALHDGGHMLTDWSDFSNRFRGGRFQATYYNAALGVILEVVRRHGEDGLRHFVDELRRQEFADGRAISRLFEEHFGQTPTRFARSLRVPFLGIDPRDLTRARALNYGIDAPGGVIVQRTRLFSPAREADLQPDDAILACNGQTVRNATELERALVEQVDAEVTLTVWRNGEVHQVTLTPTTRPTLDVTEESWL